MTTPKDDVVGRRSDEVLVSDLRAASKVYADYRLGEAADAITSLTTDLERMREALRQIPDKALVIGHRIHAHECFAYTGEGAEHSEACRHAADIIREEINYSIRNILALALSEGRREPIADTGGTR